MRSTNRLFIKLFSSFLILTFACEQLGFAAGDLKPVRVSGEGEKLRLSYVLPESVAKIEDSYKAPASSKTVFLLQDAHTNESGQLNLAKTIDILFTNEKDLHTVYAEAAVGDNSLAFLRTAKPLEERTELARAYIRKGLLHGVEYLDLTSERDFAVWGVENPELYVRSLEMYRAAAKDRERFELYLKKIRASYETLSNRLVSPSLKALLEKSEQFESGSLPLTEYFDDLSSTAAKMGTDMGSFRSLSLLRDLKSRENRLDFKKANEEEARAIQSLSSEDRRVLNEASMKAGASTLSGGMEDPQQGYFAMLEEKLAGHLADYPELFSYFDYLKAAHNINASQVLSELKGFELSLIDSLALTSDEKMFASVSRMIRLYEKLFRLTLTPSDYREYRDLKTRLNIERLTGFLNKKIMDLGTYYDRSLFLESGYEDILKSCETFYSLTAERDENFLKEMTRKMGESGERKAVLTAGGFHAANLKALLKERGISYVSIIPLVLKETNQARYESILLGQKMPPAPIQGPMGVGTMDATYAMGAAQAGSRLPVAPEKGPMLAALGARLSDISGSKLVRNSIETRRKISLPSPDLTAQGARLAQEDIAATGMSGFLGENLKPLLERDAASLKVLVREDSQKKLGSNAPITAMIEGDMSDRQAIADTVADAQVVYHVAAVSNANAARRGPMGSLKVALGTAYLMASASKARLVVHTSTESVEDFIAPYVEQKSPKYDAAVALWVDDTAEAFRNRAKQDAPAADTDEEFLEQYLLSHPIPDVVKDKIYPLLKRVEEKLVIDSPFKNGVSVRLGMLYGEGDYQAENRIAKIVQLFVFDAPIGYGLFKNEPRRLLYVKDAARILKAIGDSGKKPSELSPNGLIDLKAPDNIGLATNENVVGILRKITGQNPPIEWVNRSLPAPYKISVKTTQVLSLLPKIGLKDFEWTPLRKGLEKAAAPRLFLKDVRGTISDEEVERLVADSRPPEQILKNPGYRNVNVEQTFLVTGAAGFMMNYFLNYLLATHPKARIIAIDNFSTGTPESFIDQLAGPYKDRVVVIRGDINDSRLMEKLVSLSDFVVHGAAESKVDRSYGNEDIFYQTNVLGTRTVGDAVLAVNERRRVEGKNKVLMLHVSTDEVYGGSKDGYSDEDGRLDPQNPYAVSKLNAEGEINELNKKGLNAIVVRPTNNYGPKHVMNLIPNAVLFRKLGLPALIFGDPNKTRDWDNVWDFARALDLILHKGEPGEVYNVAGRQERGLEDTLIKFMDQVEKMRHSPDKVFERGLIALLKDNRKVNDVGYRIDDTKLRELGFYNIMADLDNGLRMVWEWNSRHVEWLIARITSDNAATEYLEPDFKDYLDKLLKQYPNLLALTKLRIAAFAKAKGNIRFIEAPPEEGMKPDEYGDYLERWAGAWVQAGKPGVMPNRNGAGARLSQNNVSLESAALVVAARIELGIIRDIYDERGQGRINIEEALADMTELTGLTDADVLRAALTEGMKTLKTHRDIPTDLNAGQTALVMLARDRGYRFKGDEDIEEGIVPDVRDLLVASVEIKGAVTPLTGIPVEVTVSSRSARRKFSRIFTIGIADKKLLEQPGLADTIKRINIVLTDPLVSGKQGGTFIQVERLFSTQFRGARPVANSAWTTASSGARLSTMGKTVAGLLLFALLSVAQPSHATTISPVDGGAPAAGSVQADYFTVDVTPGNNEKFEDMAERVLTEQRASSDHAPTLQEIRSFWTTLTRLNGISDPDHFLRRGETVRLKIPVRFEVHYPGRDPYTITLGRTALGAIDTVTRSLPQTVQLPNEPAQTITPAPTPAPPQALAPTSPTTVVTAETPAQVAPAAVQAQGIDWEAVWNYKKEWAAPFSIITGFLILFGGFLGWYFHFGPIRRINLQLHRLKETGMTDLNNSRILEIVDKLLTFRLKRSGEDVDIILPRLNEEDEIVRIGRLDKAVAEYLGWDYLPLGTAPVKIAAHAPSLSPEQETMLDQAAELFKLNRSSKLYLKQMWLRYLHPDAKPLRIITDRSNPGPEENFIPASLLTGVERETLLGAYEYLKLQKDRANARAAKNVVLTVNSLDGGIGESLNRIDFLKKLLGTEDVQMGAKGTDLGFPLVINKKNIYISIAEMKILHLIHVASTRSYGALKFQPLVNWQSRASYEKLLDSTVFLNDRLDGKKHRTYRQIMEEMGIEVVDMLEQDDLPGIEKTTGNLSLETDRAVASRQPGGHGQWGYTFLSEAYLEAPPRDRKTHIRFFNNGDNPNERPDASIAGYIARRNLPIVKLTTAATEIDRKGGKDGLRVTKTEKGEVLVPDQMELADAKDADKSQPGQLDAFYSAGLKDGLGEAGKQPFNTNMFYINDTVLHDIARELAGVIGEEEYFRIIAPALIAKDAKKGKDGVERVPIDGAIGVAIHNLNAYFLTSEDPRVKAILTRRGLDRLLYFVDVPRDFFTPVKKTSDMAFLQSDYYQFDYNNWLLRETGQGLVPPEIDLDESIPYWKELQNLVDAFGKVSMKRMVSLKIRGEGQLPNAVLAGKVEITFDAPADLNTFTALPRTEGGQLLLENVSVHIDKDGNIEVKKIEASPSEAAALPAKPAPKRRENIVTSWPMLIFSVAALATIIKPSLAIAAITALSSVPPALWLFAVIIGVTALFRFGVIDKWFGQKYDNTSPGIQPSQLPSMPSRAEDIEKKILTLDGRLENGENGSLDDGQPRWGWIHRGEEVLKSQMPEEAEAEVGRLRAAGVEAVGVIGMGGEASIVGPSDEAVDVISSTSTAKIDRLISGRDLSKMHWFIVSKSGGTTETLENAKYIINLYLSKGLDPADHITVVTDIPENRSNNKLIKLAEDLLAGREKQIAVMPRELDGTTSIGGRNTLMNWPTLLIYGWRMNADKTPGVVREMVQAVVDAHDPAKREAGTADPWIIAAIQAGELSKQGRNKLYIKQPEWMRKDQWVWQQQVFEESLAKAGKGFTVYTSVPEKAVLDNTWVILDLTGAPRPADEASGPVTLNVNVAYENEAHAQRVVAYGLMKMIAAMGFVLNVNVSTQEPVESYKKLMRTELSLEDVVTGAGKYVVRANGLTLVFDGLMPFISEENRAKIDTLLEKPNADPAEVYRGIWAILRAEKALDAQTLAFYDDVDPATAVWLDGLSEKQWLETGLVTKWGEGSGVLHGNFVGWFSGPLHQVPVHIVARQHKELTPAYEEGSAVLVKSAAAAHKSLVEAGRPSVLLVADEKITTGEPGRKKLEEFFSGSETAQVQAQLAAIAEKTKSSEQEKDRWSENDFKTISANVVDWLSASDEIVSPVHKEAIRKLLHEENASALKGGFLNEAGIIWPGTAGFRGPIEDPANGKVGPNYIGDVLMRQYADIYRSMFRSMKEKGEIPDDAYIYGLGEVRLNTERYGSLIAAGVAEAGVKVILDLQPKVRPYSTPVASHAAQYFAKKFGKLPIAGFSVTGSHNPLTDNGVKLFSPSGRQLLPQEVDKLKGFKKAVRDIQPFKEAAENIVELTDTEYGELMSDYYDALERSLEPNFKEVIQQAVRNGMRFVFTPINGATFDDTKRFLTERLGLVYGKDFLIPPDEAVLPQTDLSHPAWGYKDFDPARKDILDKTKKFAEENGITTIFARDLDGDRLVLAENTPQGWVTLDGNQNAILMLDDKLSTLKQEGRQEDLDNFVMMYTHVTSPLLRTIAGFYGVKGENIGEVPVGFKYFGAVIERSLGKWGRGFFGAEESYGPSNGMDPEKDSLAGMMNMLLVAAKAYSDGKKQAYDRLFEIYEKFGYTGDITTKIDIPGKGPAEQNGNKASALAALKSLKVDDVISGRYKISKVNHIFVAPLYSSEELQDGYRFILEDVVTKKRVFMVIRASGTEPVFKYYFFWVDPMKPSEGQSARDILAETTDYLKGVFQPALQAYFEGVWGAAPAIEPTPLGGEEEDAKGGPDTFQDFMFRGFMDRLRDSGRFEGTYVSIIKLEAAVRAIDAINPDISAQMVFDILSFVNTAGILSSYTPEEGVQAIHGIALKIEEELNAGRPLAQVFRSGNIVEAFQERVILAPKDNPIQEMIQKSRDALAGARLALDIRSEPVAGSLDLTNRPKSISRMVMRGALGKSARIFRPFALADDRELDEDLFDIKSKHPMYFDITFESIGRNSIDVTLTDFNGIEYTGIRVDERMDAVINLEGRSDIPDVRLRWQAGDKSNEGRVLIYLHKDYALDFDPSPYYEEDEEVTVREGALDVRTQRPEGYYDRTSQFMEGKTGKTMIIYWPEERFTLVPGEELDKKTGRPVYAKIVIDAVGQDSVRLKVIDRAGQEKRVTVSPKKEAVILSDFNGLDIPIRWEAAEHEGEGAVRIFKPALFEFHYAKTPKTGARLAQQDPQREAIRQRMIAERAEVAARSYSDEAEKQADLMLVRVKYFFETYPQGTVSLTGFSTLSGRSNRVRITDEDALKNLRAILMSETTALKLDTMKKRAVEPVNWFATSEDLPAERRELDILPLWRENTTMDGFLYGAKNSGASVVLRTKNAVFSGKIDSLDAQGVNLDSGRVGIYSIESATNELNGQTFNTSGARLASAQNIPNPIRVMSAEEIDTLANVFSDILNQKGAALDEADSARLLGLQADFKGLAQDVRSGAAQSDLAELARLEPLVSFLAMELKSDEDDVDGVLAGIADRLLIEVATPISKAVIGKVTPGAALNQRLVVLSAARKLALSKDDRIGPIAEKLAIAGQSSDLQNLAALRREILNVQPRLKSKDLISDVETVLQVLPQFLPKISPADGARLSTQVAGGQLTTAIQDLIQADHIIQGMDLQTPIDPELRRIWTSILSVISNLDQSGVTEDDVEWADLTLASALSGLESLEQVQLAALVEKAQKALPKTSGARLADEAQTDYESLVEALRRGENGVAGTDPRGEDIFIPFANVESVHDVESGYSEEVTEDMRDASGLEEALARVHKGLTEDPERAIGFKLTSGARLASAKNGVPDFSAQVREKARADKETELDRFLAMPEVQQFIARSLAAQGKKAPESQKGENIALLLGPDILGIFTARFNSRNDKLELSLREGGHGSIEVGFESLATLGDKVTQAKVGLTAQDFMWMIKQLELSENLALGDLANADTPVIEQYDFAAFGNVSADPTYLDYFLLQAFAADRRPTGKKIYYRFSEEEIAVVEGRIEALSKDFPGIAQGLTGIMHRKAPSDAPVVEIKPLGAAFNPAENHYVLYVRVPDRGHGEFMVYPIELSAAAGRMNLKKDGTVQDQFRDAYRVRLGKDVGSDVLKKALLGLADQGIYDDIALGAIAALEIDVFIQGARMAMRALGGSA